MKILPFKASASVSIGVEFELQIINPHTYGLVSRAKDLIRSIKMSPFQNRIKPEITQSMIEINSSIHHSPSTLQEELLSIQKFLAQEASKLGIVFCGGGTHPFQKWSAQKIFPTKRYKNLSNLYRYLSKCSTIFGQHIHIGCQSGEDAIYLTHALSRYVPHFIAMSASSPFYQGVDTGHHSSRSTVMNAYPLSGVIPYVANWQEFTNYFYKMRTLNIIESMKDFYWDIRPKPEFGTVETRVFDMPLTSKKGVIFAAYLQALALYLLQEKPLDISPEMYHLYNYNRFQASRFGFDGNIIDPFTFERRTICEDMQDTINKIEHYANQLNNMMYITLLSRDVVSKKNDTCHIREMYSQLTSLQKLVNQQCNIWSAESTEGLNG